MPTEEETPMAQVPVYRKDNGAKVYVPEHWMDHKTLSAPFRKTPLPGKKAEVTEKTPAAGDNTKEK